MPSRCLPLAATQKALCLVSRARGGGYFSNDSSRRAGLPSPVISQPQGSNPRARGTTGRVAPVQLRACPAGTLDPCRLPVDSESLPASPRCLCQPLVVQRCLGDHRLWLWLLAKARGTSQAHHHGRSRGCGCREGARLRLGSPGHLWSWSGNPTWHDTVMSTTLPASLLVLLQVQPHS